MASGGSTIYDLLGSYNNFDEPTPGWNHPQTILAVVISFMVTSWIFVAFRLYTRFVILKTPGWDDFFVILFIISGSFGSIMICTLVQAGLGKHFLLVPVSQWTSYRFRFYLANGSYTFSTTFIKLSLLFQYLRLFKKGEILRTLTIGTIMLVSVWGVSWAILAWVPCWPVSLIWGEQSAGHCWAYGTINVNTFVGVYESHTATNLILDMVVLAIPVPIYFRKSTGGRTKLGLISLLAMGAVVNVFAVWRLATIVEHRAATSPTLDPSWYTPVTIVLSCLEVDFASITASVPVFWPVLTSHINRILVTHEVTVVRQNRSSMAPGGGGSGGGGHDAEMAGISPSDAGGRSEDQIELHRSSSSPSPRGDKAGMMAFGTARRKYSRTGSDASLNGGGSNADADEPTSRWTADLHRFPAPGPDGGLVDVRPDSSGCCGGGGDGGGGGGGPRDKAGHYEDAFIMNSVDPLRAEHAAISTNITAENVAARQKKTPFQFFSSDQS